MSWSQKWSRCVLFTASLCFLTTPAQSQVERLEAVVISRNLDYIPDVEYANARDMLDVFMPKDVEEVPVVVFFHGGALQNGSKNAGEHIAARLIPHGIGVVSANYRLSPNVMHPSHVQDAAAAFSWVIQNIKRYGGDPDNVYLSGHSAGAYLAALLALDPAHLAAHGLGLDSFRGTIPISPFLFVEETAPDRPKDVWGEDPKVWLSASVTPHIGPDRGPILLIYADGDAAWRKSQNDRFSEGMRAAGNSDVIALEVPGRDHGSLMTEMNAADDRVGKAVTKFIRDQW